MIGTALFQFNLEGVDPVREVVDQVDAFLEVRLPGLGQLEAAGAAHVRRPQTDRPSDARGQRPGPGGPAWAE